MQGSALFSNRESTKTHGQGSALLSKEKLAVFLMPHQQNQTFSGILVQVRKQASAWPYDMCLCTRRPSHTYLTHFRKFRMCRKSPNPRKPTFRLSQASFAAFVVTCERALPSARCTGRRLDGNHVMSLRTLPSRQIRACPSR